MTAHNPNHNDSYQITGTGLFDGMTWGSFSGFNLPASIWTTLGTARHNNNSYTMSAMVVITRHGSCYHNPGCRHAASGTMVTVQTAQALGRRPCSKCAPHQTIIVATIERTVDQKSSSPYNSRLLALADHNSGMEA